MQNKYRQHLILYSTAACHLCEQAEAILARAAHELPGVTYRITDISDSDELFQRYGWHIPVVRFDDGLELYWPFDDRALRQHLQAPTAL